MLKKQGFLLSVKIYIMCGKIVSTSTYAFFVVAITNIFLLYSMIDQWLISFFIQVNKSTFIDCMTCHGTRRSSFSDRSSY